MRNIVYLLMLMPFLAFGVEDVAQAAPGLPFLDKILDFMRNLDGTVMIVLAGVMEFVLRMVKSNKPRSLLLLIAEVLGQVSKLSVELAQLLNKIIPQRVVPMVKKG